LLTAAAVIGIEVDFDLLANACTLSHATPGSKLSDAHLQASDELLRLGFLAETDTGYRFGHERVRQAVYQKLSPSQRRDLHRRIAAAGESLFPDQYELLAHHYYAAGKRPPTLHYLTRAAERACEVFAYHTALTCYDRLLEMLTHSNDGPIRCDVLRDRAKALGWIGNRNDQDQALDELHSLAQALSDDTRLAEALHLRSEWHRVQGQYQQAEENALAALDIYRRLGNERASADLLAQLGWSIIYTANHSRATQYFEQALPIYESLDDLEGQINCLSGLTSMAELEGDFVRALSYLKDNMALAEATDDPRRIGRALHNTGVVYYDLGDLEAAESHLRQALQIKETVGDRRSVAITHFYLGEVAIEQENFESAHIHLSAALKVFRDVQDLSWEGDTLAALGRLALLRGEPATAGEYLTTSHRRRQELGEPAYAVIDLSYLARAELALGEEKSAWQHSQEAISDLEAGLSGVEHPQQIYFNHFCIGQATRHWAAARAALEQAAQIVEERAGRIENQHMQKEYRTGLRVNRAIAETFAVQPPPGHLSVRLARADAPTHRRPTPEETVTLTWTVDAGETDADVAKREGKVALRHRRLLHLLAQAKAAGGLPTIADLSGALSVTPRTIRADLAALRQQGHTIRTRGQRS
jgi:tetratricopeptide (TPR) repeat protein